MARKRRSGKSSARRRAEFAAALSAAKLKPSQFAARCGVTYYHLWCVLRGDRKSAPLDSKIDAFIAEHAPERRPASTSSAA